MIDLEGFDFELEFLVGLEELEKDNLLQSYS
jgi:hypothetical protein